MPAIVRRQWWSAERLRAHQDARLRRLVLHAWNHVPFYRELWQSAGIRPEEIRGTADLARLPLVPSVRFKSEPYETLLADNVPADRRFSESSSGTTGVPFPVTYSRFDYFVQIKAMSVRHYGAWGVRLTDRLAIFGRHGDTPASHAWYERLGIRPRIILRGSDHPSAWIERLAAHRVDVLGGAPMVLVALAREVRLRGDTRVRPRLVFSSSSQLEPSIRREIAEAFGNARVVNIYGAHEGGFIAWQCPDCPGYHVNTDSTLIEVIDEDGRPVAPGQTGQIVVTSLYSDAMPLVRYSLGDVVTLSAASPSCGRSLPLIENIWGRNDDNVRLPSGRHVGIYPIYQVIYDRAELVREWRLVHEPTGACTLQVVPADPATFPARSGELVEAMRAALDHELEVTLSLEESIHRDHTTKWKTVWIKPRSQGAPEGA